MRCLPFLQSRGNFSLLFVLAAFCCGAVTGYISSPGMVDIVSTSGYCGFKAAA